ncbi:hypothetical protein D3C80_1696340 [compost metagenome]
MPRQPDGVAEPGDHPAFFGDQDQILITHQFADSGGHFRRDAPGDCRQGIAVGFFTQQPVTKIPDGQMRNRGKRRDIMGIDNQPRDFILFIRHQQLLQKGFERHIGQRHFCRHTLLCAGGSHFGQIVARSCGRRLCHQFAQILKLITSVT